MRDRVGLAVGVNVPGQHATPTSGYGLFEWPGLFFPSRENLLHFSAPVSVFSSRTTVADVVADRAVLASAFNQDHSQRSGDENNC